MAALREQGWQYDLSACFLEVYNEQVRLSTGSGIAFRLESCCTIPEQ